MPVFERSGRRSFLRSTALRKKDHWRGSTIWHGNQRKTTVGQGVLLLPTEGRCTAYFNGVWVLQWTTARGFGHKKITCPVVIAECDPRISTRSYQLQERVGVDIFLFRH
jgi:hypothetical protein